jgi:hypothetical protein
VASVSRVVDLLERDRLVERQERGVVRSADWEKIIRRWVQDYSLVDSNAISTWLVARGVPSAMNALGRGTPRYAITGSFAAA